MRSWARQVRTYEELPEVYRPFFDGLPSGLLEPFPYTVLMSGLKAGLGGSEIGWLALKLDGAVHLLEDADPAPRATCYPVENIHLVERGTILLHAWITVRGLDTSGTVCSTTLRFNAVTEQILVPLIEAMRAPATTGTSADLATERSRLDFLQATHFKFHSYGRASIRPGARVIQLVFQPEMRSKLFSLFGYGISRLESPAHLALLTDSELILIRDDDTQIWSRGTPHGAIWTYIPRTKISDGILSASDDGAQLLSVNLEGGTRIQSLFEPERRPELERLVHQLQT